MGILDETFDSAVRGAEERKPDIERARDLSYISRGRFFVSLDADAIEELNHEAAKQHVGVIPANAYLEVSTAGWYIVCWQDGDTQWEYDPGTGETRHCGCGADCIWTDWE